MNAPPVEEKSDEGTPPPADTPKDK